MSMSDIDIDIGIGQFGNSATTFYLAQASHQHQRPYDPSFIVVVVVVTWCHVEEPIFTCHVEDSMFVWSVRCPLAIRPAKNTMAAGRHTDGHNSTSTPCTLPHQVNGYRPMNDIHSSLDHRLAIFGVLKIMMLVASSIWNRSGRLRKQRVGTITDYRCCPLRTIMHVGQDIRTVVC